MKINLIIISLLLTGCATTQEPNTIDKTNVIVNHKTKTETVYPEKKYLDYCGNFSKIKDGYFDEVLKLREEDKNTLERCKNNHKYLSDFINLLKEKDSNK